MIITSDTYNKIKILKDSDLSLMKEIEHKYDSLYCGYYTQSKSVCYLGFGIKDALGGTWDGYLTEFNFNTV